MAAGRPVVATDVGGAREAIVHGETGYLVPAGDHELMADHIISLVAGAGEGSRDGRTRKADRKRKVLECRSNFKMLRVSTTNC